MSLKETGPPPERALKEAGDVHFTRDYGQRALSETAAEV